MTTENPAPAESRLMRVKNKVKQSPVGKLIGSRIKGHKDIPNLFGPQLEAARINERSQVVEIREVTPDDYDAILRMAKPWSTRRHMDPEPPSVRDWNNASEVERARGLLSEYYTNNGEPEKITPLVALNKDGEALGVTTIRWRGDPFIPPGNSKVAMIERLMVENEFKKKGVATALMNEAVKRVFEERGYKELRAWIMSDDKAGPFQINIKFFRKLGFRVSTGPNRHYRDYVIRRQIPAEKGRDEAMLFVLKREDVPGIVQLPPEEKPEKEIEPKDSILTPGALTSLSFPPPRPELTS